MDWAARGLSWSVHCILSTLENWTAPMCPQGSGGSDVTEQPRAGSPGGLCLKQLEDLMPPGGALPCLVP